MAEDPNTDSALEMRIQFATVDSSAGVCWTWEEPRRRRMGKRFLCGESSCLLVLVWLLCFSFLAVEWSVPLWLKPLAQVFGSRYQKPGTKDIEVSSDISVDSTVGLGVVLSVVPF